MHTARQEAKPTKLLARTFAESCQRARSTSPEAETVCSWALDSHPATATEPAGSGQGLGLTPHLQKLPRDRSGPSLPLHHHWAHVVHHCQPCHLHGPTSQPAAASPILLAWGGCRRRLAARIPGLGPRQAAPSCQPARVLGAAALGSDAHSWQPPVTDGAGRAPAVTRALSSAGEDTQRPSPWR